MANKNLHNAHYAHYLVSSNIDFALYPDTRYNSLPPVFSDDIQLCVPQYRAPGSAQWLEVCKYIRPSSEYNQLWASNYFSCCAPGVGVHSYDAALCEIVALVRRLLYRRLGNVDGSIDPAESDIPPLGYEFRVAVCANDGSLQYITYPGLMIDVYGVTDFGDPFGRSYLFTFTNPCSAKVQDNSKQEKDNKKC